MTADLSKYDETVSTARRWATQSDRDIFTTASKVEHALAAYADALADEEARLAAVQALHREHVCPAGIAALDVCFIVHGGNCANVGKCVECHKAYPCPTVKAARGESL